MTTNQQYLERLCRENGQQPTTRERWQAFYRLWRMTQKTFDPACNAGEAFRVLMYDWRWVQLVEGHGDYYATLRFLLRAVRKYKVGMDKRLSFN